jgi:hypothetical protein
MTEERRERTDTVMTQNSAGLGVGVTRNGTNVTLTFYAKDEYTSIELYDSLVRSVQAGKLDLNLSAKGSS